MTVTKYGRPSVEYERPGKFDRHALAVTELSDSDIEAIRAARIPTRHRYGSSDLP